MLIVCGPAQELALQKAVESETKRPKMNKGTEREDCWLPVLREIYKGVRKEKYVVETSPTWTDAVRWTHR